MNLAERLRAAKEKLKGATTTTTLETGDVVEEKRAKDGSFVAVTPDVGGVDDEATGVAVSNRRRKLVERAHRHGYVLDLKPDLQVAEVCDGLFLSSQDVASDLKLLQNHNITHIVNVATSVINFYPMHFTYLSIDILDFPTYNLKQHIDEVLKFTRGAIENGGKVLIHCNAGVSRSSALAIAYVMRYENKTLRDAFDQVKAAVPQQQLVSVTHPNFGFMRQLEEYEQELRLLHNHDSSKI